MTAKKTTKTTNEDSSSTPAALPEATRFEELRQRALKSGNVDTSKITDKPFTMGADWGFADNPVVIERPSFTRSEMISENIKAGDTLNALRLLFGRNVSRVAAQIDTLGKDAGPAALLLIDDVLAHFYGQGAVQVFPR